MVTELLGITSGPKKGFFGIIRTWWTVCYATCQCPTNDGHQMSCDQSKEWQPAPAGRGSMAVKHSVAARDASPNTSFSLPSLVTTSVAPSLGCKFSSIQAVQVARLLPISAWLCNDHTFWCMWSEASISGVRSRCLVFRARCLLPQNLNNNYRVWSTLMNIVMQINEFDIIWLNSLGT